MTEYSYRKRSMERKLRKKRRLTVIGIALAALLVIAAVVILIVKVFANDSTGTNDDPFATPVRKGSIEDGVYIENIAVGGMKYDEAAAEVEKYADTLGTKQLVVDVNGKSVSVSLSDLLVACNIQKAVSEAYDLKEAAVVKLDITLDDAKLKNFISKECAKHNVKAKNAGLKRKNGEFTVTKSRTGKYVVEEKTAELILNSLSGALTSSAVNVTAAIKTKEPEYTSEDMAECTDTIGKFSTTFQESQVERSANLRNAVSFIDGSMVYPGETFSVADTIYPLSADNGYKEAPSYADGEVVESLGGGVCQVSTTLYNAVLRAELEIVERLPHSMVVTYVQPSMDAAIAGDYKDLKFANNTDTPIYIQGSVYGGVITFTIYGKETRPSSRKIEFVSEKVETIQPGKDIITKDASQPEGYEKVTQQAHVGYVANLYKVVYENGVETSREKINYSKYNAEPRHVIVGTKKEKTDKDKDKNKDKNKDKAKATKAPDNNTTSQDTPQTQATGEPAVATEAPQEPAATEEPSQEAAQ